MSIYVLKDYVEDCIKNCVKPTFEGLNIYLRKEPDEWLDSKEVCEILCVSPRSLQHLRNSGTLSFTRIDKKIFYRKQDVVSLLTTVQKKK